MYEKDFKKWITFKDHLDKRNLPMDFNVHEGDIWWTSLGVNIGSEIDGKNHSFERPVVIVKFINRSTVYVVPMTSKYKNNNHHFEISYMNKKGWVIMSQLRLVSTKRLLRKISKISSPELDSMKLFLVSLFK